MCRAAPSPKIIELWIEFSTRWTVFTLIPDRWKTNEALLNEVATFYDEDYYGSSYDTTGIPYSRDEEHWLTFFAAVARSIVDTLKPSSVLDVGCATGMLVEALRDEGVDARGIDVSSWAIEHVPENLRPYCTKGTITGDIEGSYDLITCIEVAEHLPAFSVNEAIANLCRHTDAVLFSSTPDDFDEPTHLNVQSSGYWADLFVRCGFLRDVDYDASYLAGHAVLFRRADTDTSNLVHEYERALSATKADAVARREAEESRAAAVAEHDQLAERYNTLAGENKELFAEYSRVADQLGDLSREHMETESRRKAELEAAHDQISKLQEGSHALYLSLRRREEEIETIYRTKTFRYTALASSALHPVASTDDPGGARGRRR